MIHLLSFPYAVHTARMCRRSTVRGRILLVTEVPPHLSDVRERLLHKHYTVTTARGFDAILRHAESGAVDVVLLDLTGGTTVPLALCRALRSAGMTVPVLMLNLLGSLDDLLDGFDAGADVYLLGQHGLADLPNQVGILCRQYAESIEEQRLAV